MPTTTPPKRHTVLDFHTLLQACPREKDRAKILILQFISENGKASRKMVIQALRMRPSTVSNSIAEMIDDGLLSELSMRTNAHSGRPELSLSINPERFWPISFSIM